jgi:hypothetical protein
MELGNGLTAKFWEDRWTHGETPYVKVLHSYTLVSPNAEANKELSLKVWLPTVGLKIFIASSGCMN